MPLSFWISIGMVCIIGAMAIYANWIPTPPGARTCPYCKQKTFNDPCGHCGNNWTCSYCGMSVSSEDKEYPYCITPK